MIWEDLLKGANRKMFTRSTFTRIVTGSGTVTVPTGAIGMRVAAIGGGASGASYSADQCGGGGGGCAATKIVPAESVIYSIGAGGSSSNGGDTTASFTGYSLVGGGGSIGTTTVAGAGGAGSGGDYNFTGGTGGFYPFSTGSATGGGAAGPNGNGGDGVVEVGSTTRTLGNPGSLSGTGWGPGGGAGGSLSGTYQVLGGSGPGQTAQVHTDGNFNRNVAGPAPATYWGRPGNDTYTFISPGSINLYLYDGGEMGGGGSAVDEASNGSGISDGGSGGLVIEWFYVD